VRKTASRSKRSTTSLNLELGSIQDLVRTDQKFRSPKAFVDDRSNVVVSGTAQLGKEVSNSNRTPVGEEREIGFSNHNPNLRKKRGS